MGLQRICHSPIPGKTVKDIIQFFHENTVIFVAGHQSVGTGTHIADEDPAIHDKRIPEFSRFNSLEIMMA